MAEIEQQIIIIDSTPSHVRELGNNLRSADRKEVEAAGFTVSKALWRSYKNSIICKSIFVDKDLAAMFGIGGDLLGDIASPWLMTTPACEKVSPLKFTRIYQQQVLDMLKLYPILQNHVDEKYTKSIRLLQNIGFSAGEAKEINGSLFREFSMRRA